MCNAHLCSVVGFSINHWLLEILAFIFFSFVLWILSTKYLGCWGCFFPTPLCSLLRNIYSFHFWREREGLGGIFHVVFYFVPLFLLPSTFLGRRGTDACWHLHISRRHKIRARAHLTQEWLASFLQGKNWGSESGSRVLQLTPHDVTGLYNSSLSSEIHTWRTHVNTFGPLLAGAVWHSL